MRNVTLIVIASFFVAVSAVRADFDPARSRFMKELTPERGTGGQPFGEVTFDTETLSGAKPDLSDIRVVTADDRETPYVLATEAPQTALEQYAATVSEKSVVRDEYTTFVVDVGRSDAVHNELELMTSSVNFLREVTVEGSADKQNWAVLGEQSIYDYAFEFKARATRVRYADGTFRYLRVTIWDRGEAPVTILGAAVRRRIVTPGKEVGYPAFVADRAQNAAERASIVTFDLGAHGLPTDRLTLEVSQTNFSRAVALEGSNDRASWTIIVPQSVIFSYATPKFTGSALAVTYPERNYRYFRLTIFNKDDAPVVVTGGTFFGLVRKLVFAAQPGASYRLFYGDPASRRAEYDLGNFLAYFDQGARTPYALGPQQPNPRFQEVVPPPPPLSERYPWLLPVTLAAVVLVLGFLVFRLFRRAKEVSPPAR